MSLGTEVVHRVGQTREGLVAGAAAGPESHDDHAGPAGDEGGCREGHRLEHATDALENGRIH
jgi:hypothetical protein